MTNDEIILAFKETMAYRALESAFWDEPVNMDVPFGIEYWVRKEKKKCKAYS